MIVFTRNPIAFIALLFCMAAASLLCGAIALWEQIDYYVNGKAAVMVLANPTKKLIIPSGGPDVHAVDVRYVRPDGELVVTGKFLDAATAKRLAAGERVPITYMKNKPQHVYFRFEEPPNPWVWLTVGVALFATFIYAVRLRRREAHELTPGT